MLPGLAAAAREAQLGAALGLGIAVPEGDVGVPDLGVDLGGCHGGARQKDEHQHDDQQGYQSLHQSFALLVFQLFHPVTPFSMSGVSQEMVVVVTVVCPISVLPPVTVVTCCFRWPLRVRVIRQLP